MTTFTDFVPNVRGPFSWQPTLDGTVYTATVTWNLFAQRWYINVFDLTGNLQFSLPLIGSDIGLKIQAIAWDQLEQVVDVVTAEPHGRHLGDTIDFTIADCVPDAFNGIVRCLITGPSSFTYPMAADPGVATVFGTVAYNISLSAGYFASTLVYRQANKQFEVSP